jgi:hypothetical protein
MVLPDLNFTPPEEDNVYIPEGEHAGTLSTAKQSFSFSYIKLYQVICIYSIAQALSNYSKNRTIILT